MSANSRVILFGFVEHKEFICEKTNKKKQIAKCKFCKKSTTITEVSGTTSNYTRHLQRSHKERYGFEFDICLFIKFIEY